MNRWTPAAPAGDAGWRVTSTAATMLARRVTGSPVVRVNVTPDVASGATPIDVTGSTVTVHAAGFAGADESRMLALDQYATRFANPKLAGAVVAGAVWAVKPALPASASEVAAVLDRVRAEARHVQRRPPDGLLLTAALPAVVARMLTDGAGVDPVSTVSLLLAHVWTRVALGVLPPALAAVCSEAAGGDLPGWLLTGMGAICERLRGLPDGNSDVVVETAAEWDMLLRRLFGDGSGPGVAGARPAVGEAPDGADGGPGDGGGSPTAHHSPNEDNTGTSDVPGFTDTNGDSAADDATGDTGNSGNGDTTVTEGPWTADAPAAATWGTDTAPCAAAAKAAATLQDAAQAAAAAAHEYGDQSRPRQHPEQARAAANHQAGQKVFAQQPTLRSRNAVARTPATAADRVQLAQLVTELRKARYVAASRTDVPAGIPPARLRTSLLLQRAAQQSMGEKITARPWSTVRTRNNPHPPLTVGFVADCSGSTSLWHQALGRSVWATVRAARMLGGDGAAALFADTVVPMLAPGDKLATIPIPTLTGGSSGCGTAMRAVDGILHMAARPGARLMVVLTDSQLPDLRDCELATDYLAGRGVVVLWVNIAGNTWHPRSAYTVRLERPDQFGAVVGKACADALTAAATRRKGRATSAPPGAG